MGPGWSHGVESSQGENVLAKFTMTVEAFYLCYNTKQMQQYGYWKRQRGTASSKSVEQVLLAYMGQYAQGHANEPHVR